MLVWEHFLQEGNKVKCKLCDDTPQFIRTLAQWNYI